MSDFIPDGFAPLAEWDFRERQKQDGHSPEWKALSDAAKAGQVPAFKLSNGRWYVHKQKAAEFLAKCFLTPAEPSVKAAANTCGIDKRHAESVCESLSSIDTTLDEIYRVLERLTNAVEGIATQPKAEAAGTWRDMNGESL